MAAKVRTGGRLGLEPAARPAARAAATRESILAAAERLFAERGLDSVSHRQISLAAGQGNVAAVNYHFGTTEDLVRAVVRRHQQPIEELRLERVNQVQGSADLRDWVGCLVYPLAEHLESLGSPTWWARCGAQVTTDPRYRALMVADAMDSQSLQLTLLGLNRCLSDVPEAIRSERGDMARLLSVHVFAEREAELAAGARTARSSWLDCAEGLIDATVGLWQAPTHHAAPR